MSLSATQLAGVERLGRAIFNVPDDVEDAGFFPAHSFGWSETDLATVITELHHFPDPYLYGGHEKWQQWGKEASELLGFPVYFDFINSAVAALFEV